MIRVADPQNPRGIVWLASYPKSGNTWLRVFLYQIMRIQNGHPREDDELNKLDRASGYEAKLFALFEKELGKPLAAADFDQTMRARPAVQQEVARRLPNIALMKTHNLFGYVDDIPIINPQASAGAIYVVRDPRDVAVSLARFMDSSIDEAIDVMNTPTYRTENDRETAAELWGSWSEHVMSWTIRPNPATLVVRYEDMLAKPTETFTSIIAHLRQAPTAAQIEEAIALSSFGELRQQEDEHTFRENSDRAERFFVSGKAGGWRDTLNATQVARLERVHNDQMSRHGYLD